MKTLVIQTTLRPDPTRPINLTGTMADLWRGHVPLDVAAEELTIDARNGGGLSGPIYVRFTSDGNDATKAEYYSAVGFFIGEDSWDNDTPIAIRGVGCHVDRQTRTILDIRDNPTNALEAPCAP